MGFPLDFGPWNGFTGVKEHPEEPFQAFDDATFRYRGMKGDQK